MSWIFKKWHECESFSEWMTNGGGLKCKLEPMENRIMVKVLERENQGLSAIKYVVAIRSM